MFEMLVPIAPVLRELKAAGYPVIAQNGCYLPENRNILISGSDQRIKQTHPDGLSIFIDTDMGLTMEDVQALEDAAYSHDIIGVPYPTQKNDGRDCCGRTGGRGIIPVNEIGFGLIAIQHRVFNKLEFPYFELPTVRRGKFANLRGEDIYFCEKARKAGFKIHAHYGIHINHHLRQGAKTMNQPQNAQLPDTLAKQAMAITENASAANKLYEMLAASHRQLQQEIAAKDKIIADLTKENEELKSPDRKADENETRKQIKEDLDDLKKVPSEPKPPENEDVPEYTEPKPEGGKAE